MLYSQDLEKQHCDWETKLGRNSVDLDIISPSGKKILYSVVIQVIMPNGWISE